MVTIILPLFAGRLANSMAATTLAPVEIPTRIPSSFANRRAIANASSLVTWMHSVICTLRNVQITECIQVNNDEAFAMARRLAKEEGILVGISTGANVVAAIELAKRPANKGKMIVTIACSTGERYLSTALAAEARAEVGG